MHLGKADPVLQACDLVMKPGSRLPSLSPEYNHTLTNPDRTAWGQRQIT